MDNNLDQELFSENNGNNNEQPKTKENEGMSYENLDPMGILMELTAKSEEISKKINKIEALQDNRIEFDKTLKDLQSEVKNFMGSVENKHQDFLDFFFDNAKKLIVDFKKVKLGLNEEDLQELKSVSSITKKLTDAYNEKELKVIHFFNRMKYWILGSFALLIILNIITGDLARIWYRTSVQTKQETRAELLDEIKKSGKGIYEIQHIEELERNTKIIQSWRKTAPKSSVDNFDTFMDGYFAKEK